MPVYLLHGFRWPRPLIRVHIIFQNLDDAAAEWLVAPQTTLTLLQNFHELYPESMEHLHHLRFVEQYDPNDVSSSATSQPYAYVADVCEEIKLGVDVEDVRGKGLGNDQWAAMMDLRDKVAPEEKVAWYIVVCGDEERWAPPTMSVLNSGGSVRAPSQNVSSASSSQGSSGPTGKPATPPEGQQRGLRKFLSGRLGRRKSRASVVEQPNGNSVSEQSSAPPPVPTTETSTAQPPSEEPRSGRSPGPPGPMKLQTTNLPYANGFPKSASTAHLPPILQADEEHEVIMGPEDDMEEDEMSAEPPVVKSRTYKNSDLPTEKKKKRRSLPGFALSPRNSSPDMPRNMSPLARQGNAFAAQQDRAESPLRQSMAGAGVPPHVPTTEDVRPPASFRNVSPVNSAAGSGRGTPTLVSPVSMRPPQSILSPISPDSPHRSRSPNKMMYSNGQRASSQGRPSRPGSVRPNGSIQTTPNASAINLARSASPPMPNGILLNSPSRTSLAETLRPSMNPETQSIASRTSKSHLTSPIKPPMDPAKATTRRASRTSLAGTINTTNGGTSRAAKRNSLQSLGGASTMSPTVQALYGQHEKEWTRHRQSVTPEELVARGLDEGVFAGLK
ncbi:hypothetical protein B0A48_17887 [Cryoendolithus antarcticus]|uniref:Uncharacterized protein n=1 Tax=Cryoendolithus antarcticus TaxID=1507870 RepID=A0A1V8SAR3_9PEZI|nr:hypothetical protein B0A48_17887 [Cryoendolithus antarcticus]